MIYYLNLTGVYSYAPPPPPGFWYPVQRILNRGVRYHQSQRKSYQGDKKLDRGEDRYYIGCDHRHIIVAYQPNTNEERQLDAAPPGL